MATKLAVNTQPVSANSGDDFLVPVIDVQNADNSLDTTFNSAITVVWVNESGAGVLGGTTSKTPLNGTVAFYDVYVVGACTGHFDVSGPGLTGVSTASITIGAAPTGIKIAYGTRLQGGSSSTRYRGLYKSPSQQNTIASTGQQFDYKILIEVQNSSGVRDTSFSGPITASVAVGTCTLGGTLTRNCVRGRADFSDLIPATGTGPLSITFSGGGLTSFTTAVMNVVAPKWDIYQYAPGQFRLIELPRIDVDTTYPTSFATEYTVNPSGSNTGNNRTTIQGIIDKIVVDNPSGNVRVKVTPGTYNETLRLKTKAANSGLICFEPLSGIPGQAGKRITPAEVTAAGVRFTTDVVNNYTIDTDGLAHHYRFSGIEITQDWSTSTFFAFALVAFSDAYLTIDPTNPRTINEVPHHNGLNRCWIHGQIGRGLRKGINDEGSYNFVTDCYIDEIHALRSPDQGSGDENGIYSINAVGPCLYENNMIRATGETMLFGGSNPAFYERVPTDVTIRKNVLLAPRSWQPLYKHKNNIEFKMGRRVLVEQNIHDGAWNGNQDGAGIRFGSGNQYGGTIDNYEGVYDLTFRYNLLRNMQAAFSLSESISPDSKLMTRISIHDNIGVNIDDPTTWIDGSGNRASASEITRITIWSGSTVIIQHHNTLLASEDPATTSTRAIYFGDRSYPSLNSYYRDNISTARGYGVITGDGGIGSLAVTQGSPDNGSFNNVLITGPNNGTNYAYGAVHGNGMSALGNQFPPEAYYPATLAAVGFVDPTISSGWDTASPESIIAALALSSGSPHKGVASDGGDPGANTTLLSTLLAGVWDGTGIGIYPPTAGFSFISVEGESVGVTPDHLTLEVEPAGTISGVPLPVQPHLKVRDVDGLQVNGYSGLCVAQVVMGNATITAGRVVAAIDGDIQFTNLTLVGAGDITLAFSIPEIQGIIATNEVNLPPGTGAASAAHRRQR